MILFREGNVGGSQNIYTYIYNYREITSTSKDQAAELQTPNKEITTEVAIIVGRLPILSPRRPYVYIL
jgi:hypothetical protein